MLVLFPSLALHGYKKFWSDNAMFGDDDTDGDQ